MMMTAYERADGRIVPSGVQNRSRWAGNAVPVTHTHALLTAW